MWIYVIVLILAIAISVAMRPKPQSQKPPSLADFANNSGASNTAFFVHCFGRSALMAATGHSGAEVVTASISYGRPMP